MVTQYRHFRRHARHWTKPTADRDEIGGGESHSFLACFKVVCVNYFLGKYTAFRLLYKGEDEIGLNKKLSRTPAVGITDQVPRPCKPPGALMFKDVGYKPPPIIQKKLE